jgi:hypothetical protein
MRLEKWRFFIAATLELLLISPVVVALFAPDKSVYLSYGAIMGPGVQVETILYHSFVNAASIGAVCAGSLILSLHGRTKWRDILIVFEMAIAVWLNNKRFIVALAVVLLFAVGWYRSSSRKGRVRNAALGLLVIALSVAFNQYYQLSLRPYAVIDADAVYNGLRGDYGRDRSIKVVIYRQLYPEVGSILEYPGQSIVFALAAFVPRNVWPSKPWPYYMYFTAAAFEVPIKDVRSGQTTSWLDESIANMGWLGVLSGPLLIAWICKIADASQYPPFQVLTIAICSFMLSVSIDAWLIVVAMWIPLAVLLRVGARRRAGHRRRLVMNVARTG